MGCLSVITLTHVPTPVSVTIEPGNETFNRLQLEAGPKIHNLYGSKLAPVSGSETLRDHSESDRLNGTQTGLWTRNALLRVYCGMLNVAQSGISIPDQMVMEATCDWDLLDFGGHGIQLATDLKVGSAYALTHCLIKHGCNWGNCGSEPAQPKSYSLSHRIQISLLQRSWCYLRCSRLDLSRLDPEAQ
ncbi:hypothetical protein GPALN_011916 [Globodera pallida]|nr:hypothetical protein GPALN_011916 [Globodera pallida]